MAKFTSVCRRCTTSTPQVLAVYDKLQSLSQAEFSHPVGHGIPVAGRQQVSAAEQFQHPSQPMQLDVHLAQSAADVPAAVNET